MIHSLLHYELLLLHVVQLGLPQFQLQLLQLIECVLLFLLLCTFLHLCELFFHVVLLPVHLHHLLLKFNLLFELLLEVGLLLASLIHLLLKILKLLLSFLLLFLLQTKVPLAVLMVELGGDLLDMLHLVLRYLVDLLVVGLEELARTLLLLLLLRLDVVLHPTPLVELPQNSFHLFSSLYNQ